MPSGEKSKEVWSNQELRKKASESKLDWKNPMWRGDEAGIGAVHKWIKRRLKKPPYCERCGKKKDKLDLANISQKYLRRLDDWEYICRSCHMKSDNRMDNLLKGHQGRQLRDCLMCGRLTTGVKFCKVCRKIRRQEWWREYNKSPKRIKYLKKYYRGA